MIEMPRHIILLGDVNLTESWKPVARTELVTDSCKPADVARLDWSDSIPSTLPANFFSKTVAINPHFLSPGLLDIVMRLLLFSHKPASFSNRGVGVETVVA